MTDSGPNLTFQRPSSATARSEPAPTLPALLSVLLGERRMTPAAGRPEFGLTLPPSDCQPPITDAPAAMLTVAVVVADLAKMPMPYSPPAVTLPAVVTTASAAPKATRPMDSEPLARTLPELVMRASPV